MEGRDEFQETSFSNFKERWAFGSQALNCQRLGTQAGTVSSESNRWQKDALQLYDALVLAFQDVLSSIRPAQSRTGRTGIHDTRRR